MKSEPDHLPQSKQHELEPIQHILLEEFAAATANATASHKRNGKVLKIILFGSFARDDWVDEPENGYQSDYDLLTPTSPRSLTIGMSRRIGSCAIPPLRGRSTSSFIRSTK